MNQSTQTEIDAALVECLRILARRGRQLREERERQEQARHDDQNPETNQQQAQEAVNESSS